MQRVTKEEYLASLRRQSSGFSRGVSKYRGVARSLFFFSSLFIYFNTIYYLYLGNLHENEKKVLPFFLISKEDD